ncbi:TonB-dependent receptor plug domain-containing protein [Desulfococcus sp.]|uniref:TonB-dependent receptor plug domain-containing protein n=1 Tax=Desulfococcus sp. TaxID=2025834 RepID=UPI003593A7B8
MALGAGRIAGASEQLPGSDDTFLMFVGEDIEVLTIASRREESASRAPAVAGVVTRKEFIESGRDTLSKVLETVPGFFMAEREWGTKPYLRGTPDSTLFLYDTVPLTSDFTKSLNSLDHDLSLAPVKRIEIIRGPGSVLWGPDAFAGIVNVVPLTGKDFAGVETGVLYGAPGDEAGFYTNLGCDGGLWDGFLSISGRRGDEDDTTFDVIRFWGDGRFPVRPSQRYGEDQPGTARYLEASGNASIGDLIVISGRVADSHNPYAMKSMEKNLSWGESLDDPMNYVKLESKLDIDRKSLLRATLLQTWLNAETRVIDREYASRESTSFAELTYDRAVGSGKNQFTGGLSYREKRIKDAIIWEGYLPKFLDPDNRFLLPVITQEDYATRLWSVFGQYSHRIGSADVWLGLRYDDHDAYKDHISYNTGASWPLSDEWIFKLIVGNAYRTPFAKQLLEGDDVDLERITSVNLQAAWEPLKQVNAKIGGFFNRIDNHIMEDTYAGLSQPNHQDIYGVELEGRLSPHATLDIYANLTLMNNAGPEETFSYVQIQFPDPDTFMDLNYPYDIGAKTLFNLTGAWRPNEKFTAYVRAGYASERDLVYLDETDPDNPAFRSFSASGFWTLDLNGTIHDVGYPGLDLELAVDNVANTRYETPGTYGLMEGPPASARITLRKTW